MKSSEPGFDPFNSAEVAEAEKRIVSLQTRLDDLFKKFGIDPDEKVNFDDKDFVLKAMKPGSKEWAQTKLGVIEDMIHDASVGRGEYLQQAEDALKSVEKYEPMEKFESAPREPQSTEEAVSRFLDGDNSAAVSFLRAHRDEIGEFCLQVRDSYQKQDAAPFLKLSQLIRSLL